MKIHKVKQPETNKRRVTSRAFWDRVTEEKYATLIGMAKEDNLLAARISMINGAEYVDLDENKLNDAFRVLKENGLFTEEEEAIIFADSTWEELPEKLKGNTYG